MRKIFVIAVIALLSLFILKGMNLVGKSHVIFGIAKNRDGSLPTNDNEIKVTGYLVEHPDDKLSINANTKGIWVINVGNHQNDWNINYEYKKKKKNTNSESEFFRDKTEIEIKLTSQGAQDLGENLLLSVLNLSGHSKVIALDLSGDGKVTAYDATLILQHLAGITKLEESQKYRVDVNGDDSLTVEDAKLILKKVVDLK